MSEEMPETEVLPPGTTPSGDGPVETVSEPAKVMRVGSMVKQLLDEVKAAPLDDARGNFRYAPGKWSVKEVLGHLCDAERIFSYRLLRIARADTTPLPGFDENAYVPPAEFDARPIVELVREFRL